MWSAIFTFVNYPETMEKGFFLIKLSQRWNMQWTIRSFWGWPAVVSRRMRWWSWIMADLLRQSRRGMNSLSQDSWYGISATLTICFTYFRTLIASHGEIAVLTDGNYLIPQLLLLVFEMSSPDVLNGAPKGQCTLCTWIINSLQSSYLFFFEIETLVLWGLFGRTMGAFQKSWYKKKSLTTDWTGNWFGLLYVGLGRHLHWHGLTMVPSRYFLLFKTSVISSGRKTFVNVFVLLQQMDLASLLCLESLQLSCYQFHKWLTTTVTTRAELILQINFVQSTHHICQPAVRGCNSFYRS